MSDKNYLIRKIQIDDLTVEYYKLLREISLISIPDMNEKQNLEFIKQLDDNHQIYLMINCQNNKIVATGTILIENKLIRNYGKIAHIEDIAVDKTERNKGLGKKLINFLIDVSVERNCYKVILNCDTDLIYFYQSCGFDKKGDSLAIYLKS